jgi:hypothetical protein
MPEVLPPPKVPTIVTTRFNEDDRTILAELMKLSGLTEGTQLVRFSLRLARDYMLAAKGQHAPNNHVPVEPR